MRAEALYTRPLLSVIGMHLPKEVGSINIADEIKKQTDRILRQRQLGSSAAKIIIETPGEGPVISDPTADLEAHKTADDHSNYLTEERHDLLNHEGLPGVPAPEEFTDSVHALTDHTGLPGVGGGTFTELSDVPNEYTGQAGKVAAVNTTETGIEFITPSSGASGSFDFGNITEAASYSWDYGGLT